MHMTMQSLMFTVLFLSLINYSSQESNKDPEQGFPCVSKLAYRNPKRVVCVCNETYCDTFGGLKDPQEGQFVLYWSDESGRRLERINGSLSTGSGSSSSGVTIILHPSVKKQTIIGFGGAFTDATGFNLRTLPAELQAKLIRSYFDKDGIGYTIGRIPTAGCDFSTRKYTYADNDGKPDPNLTSFRLQQEDYEDKIPFINLAQSLEPDLILLSSPWTAPPWMKTNNDYSGRGFLKSEYRQLWANYIVKFLDEYKSHNISMWGLTPQNEPFDGRVPLFPFNCMGWTAEMQRDWIRDYLGPTLHRNGYGDVKLIILDDNAWFLQKWVQTVMSDSAAAKYVAGVGVHWYWRGLSGYDAINKTFNDFPNTFILGTEACNGAIPWEKHVVLGSWDRGQAYAEDIIQQLNHGSSGWVDWNMALGPDGGPNWAQMPVDSPIIINPDKKEFYKQPMFYVLAHFAKFLKRGSTLIQSQVEATSRLKIKRFWKAKASPASGVLVASVQRVDGSTVTTILNKNNVPVPVGLKVGEGNLILSNITLTAKSVTTILFKMKM